MFSVVIILAACLYSEIAISADKIANLNTYTVIQINNDSVNSYKSRAVHLDIRSSQLYILGISSLATKDIKHNQSVWMWTLNTIEGTISETKLKNDKNDSIKIFDIQCLQNTDNGNLIAVITTGNEQSNLVSINHDGKVILIKKLDMESKFSKILPTIDNNLILVGHKSLKSSVLKIDVNGNEIWSKVFDREKHESFVDGIPTSDGGFILIENSGKYEKFFMGESDLFVTKFDSNGNKVDERFLPGRYGSIAQGKDGGFAVVYDKKADSSQDIWIQAYDKQMRPLWSHNITTAKLGLGKFKAAGLANGNYIVAGTVNGKPWVTYLDSNGTRKWDYLSASTDFENGIDIVANGDYCYLISTVIRLNADKALNNYIKVVKFRPN